MFKLEVEVIDSASPRSMGKEKQNTQQDGGREERCHRPHDDRTPIPRRDGREPAGQLRRAVRNRYRHAIEQASPRWREVDATRERAVNYDLYTRRSRYPDLHAKYCAAGRCDTRALNRAGRALRWGRPRSLPSPLSPLRACSSGHRLFLSPFPLSNFSRYTPGHCGNFKADRDPSPRHRSMWERSSARTLGNYSVSHNNLARHALRPGFHRKRLARVI